VNRLPNDDADVLYKLGEMQEYVATDGIPGDAIVKMAKLGLVIDRWMRETDVNVSAVQCWTSLEEDNPDKAVCFHCSNLPKSFFEDVKMDYQAIIAGTVGRDNTYGTVVGKVRSSPMSYARFSTDDRTGKIRGYVGEGRFTDDPLTTFGGAGVAEIPRLQQLLRFICANGFEHHVAATMATVADAVHEATTRYLGWDVLRHA
jgi:L-fucose isomerase-like protein